MKKQGFSLTELLIVIAVISLLAAVLIPMLFNSRSRTFDVVTQSCLKAVSTRQMASSTQKPYKYNTALNPASFSACEGVVFTANTSVTESAFNYEAKHELGDNTYTVSAGTGVAKVN